MRAAITKGESGLLSWLARRLSLWQSRVRPFLFGGAGQGKPRMLIVCGPGGDHFVNGFPGLLSGRLDARVAIFPVAKPTPLHLFLAAWPIIRDVFIPMFLADVIWLEWGNRLSAALSRLHCLLCGKKVILRVHRYEIHEGLVAKVDYSHVTDVVFVSEYFKGLFVAENPGLAASCQLHVVPNAIDLAKFPFRGRPRGNRVAFVVRRLAPVKDPFLLLHAFHFLEARHPGLELHVAGAMPADQAWRDALRNYVDRNGLGATVTFHGFVRDVGEWLESKDFIMCTSICESQGVGLLEAMHRGLRPLIYSFPGAERLYPERFLWRNFDELERLFTDGPEPAECSEFVARRHSAERLRDDIYGLVFGGEGVLSERG